MRITGLFSPARLAQGNGLERGGEMIDAAFANGTTRNCPAGAGTMAQPASSAAGAQASYGFTGVALSSPVQMVPRGERIAGAFSCIGSPCGGDGADLEHDDPCGFIEVCCGQMRLISDGPLRIQRLITPGFFRIAIRAGCVGDDGERIGQINLGFYSDPEHCLGPSFRLERLNMAEIAFPAIYINGLDGDLILNGKLQTLGE